MRKPVPALLFIIFSFVLASCASANGGHRDGAATPSATGDQSLITRNDLDRFPSSTAYEIVHRLRPQWLTARGQGVLRYGATPPAVTVYLGNSELGGVEELQNFTGAQLASIEHLDAAHATMRFGAGNMSGAIVLTQR